VEEVKRLREEVRPERVVVPVPPFPTGRVPVTPEVRGRPVALVRTTALGVPRAGVLRVGEVARTTLPEPVEEVVPVPPLATGRVPVTALVRLTPEMVLDPPEITLLVRVWEAEAPTRISELVPGGSWNVTVPA
jgi:hypothetical protein